MALLVHPQQPLSYLERLIQSELPSIKNEKGEEKVPAVHFRAEDSQQDAIEPAEKKVDDTPEDLYEDAEGELEETKFEGRTEKTGKLGRKSEANPAQLGEGGVESYSGFVFSLYIILFQMFRRSRDPPKSMVLTWRNITV